MDENQLLLFFGRCIKSSQSSEKSRCHENSPDVNTSACPITDAHPSRGPAPPNGPPKSLHPQWAPPSPDPSGRTRGADTQRYMVQVSPPPAWGRARLGVCQELRCQAWTEACPPPRPGFRKASGIEWNSKGEERQGVNETQVGREQARSRKKGQVPESEVADPASPQTDGRPGTHDSASPAELTQPQSLPTSRAASVWRTETERTRGYFTRRGVNVPREK